VTDKLLLSFTSWTIAARVRRWRNWRRGPRL